MRLPLRPRATVMACLAAGAVLAAACSRSGPPAETRIHYGSGVPASERLIGDGQPIPKGGGSYKIGTPYRVDGQWYVPREEPNYDSTGLASFYAADFHGRRTANGEIFDMRALTAAHPTLPLPSYAYVTNLDNGRTLLVRVNDRGPYVNDRVIDLSRAVARYLGMENLGLARVRVRYAGPAPLSGDDRNEQGFLANQSWFRVALSFSPAGSPAGYR
jgi:rare lipoprotein A